MELAYDGRMFQELTTDEMMLIDGGGLAEAADALIAILGVSYGMVAAVYAVAFLGPGAAVVAVGSMGLAIWQMGRTLAFW